MNAQTKIPNNSSELSPVGVELDLLWEEWISEAISRKIRIGKNRFISEIGINEWEGINKNNLGRGIHIWGQLDKVNHDRGSLQKGESIPLNWEEGLTIRSYQPYPDRERIVSSYTPSSPLPIPLGWFDRLGNKVKEVKLKAPQGLNAHIDNGWESEEWKDHPFISNRMSKHNKAAFKEAVAYLYSCSIQNGGLLYFSVVKQIYNSDNAELFLDLLTRKWTSKTNHYECKLATSYERSNKTKEGNRVVWSDFITKQKLIDVTLTSKSVVRTFNNYAQKQNVTMGDNCIVHGEYSRWMELDVLSHDKIERRLIQLEISGYKHNGKPLKNIPKPATAKDHRALQKESTLACDWLATYDHWVKQPCFYSKNLDRHYSPSIQIPSVIRAMFTWHGKSLSWVDVASMHPTILLMEYRAIASDGEKAIIDSILMSDIAGVGEINPRDNIYFMGKMNGIDVNYDTFKEENFIYYNASQGLANGMATNLIYRLILPGFAMWLEFIKTMTPMKHKTVSRWLLAKEATIMEEILVKVWNKGIFAIGAHDGLDCDRSHVNDVVGVFKDVFARYGIPCNLSFKNDKKPFEREEEMQGQFVRD